MPLKRTTPTGYGRARRLRKLPSVAELTLWKHLRAHRLAGVAFRRQHAIGPYIVDFCSPRHKLLIEVDGGQHMDRKDYDDARTVFLESIGYRVIRFWDNEVVGNITGVLEAILRKLNPASESE
jgi:very-short-patch-repair endonuclease